MLDTIYFSAKKMFINSTKIEFKKEVGITIKHKKTSSQLMNQLEIAM